MWKSTKKKTFINTWLSDPRPLRPPVTTHRIYPSATNFSGFNFEHGNKPRFQQHGQRKNKGWHQRKTLETGWKANRCSSGQDVPHPRLIYSKSQKNQSRNRNLKQYHGYGYGLGIGIDIDIRELRSRKNYWDEKIGNVRKVFV